MFVGRFLLPILETTCTVAHGMTGAVVVAWSFEAIYSVAYAGVRCSEGTLLFKATYSVVHGSGVVHGRARVFEATYTAAYLKRIWESFPKPPARRVL